MGESEIDFGFDSAQKLAQGPFTVFHFPSRRHCIYRREPLLKRLARVKVRWIVFGQGNEARAGGHAHADNFGEKVRERATIWFSCAGHGQRSISERTEIS